MQSMVFIDTSILCNLVPVPGRDQDREAVQDELKTRMGQKQRFILPITAVVEAGNFIAQVSDGRLRRETAQKLEEILRFVCEGRSPWVLHDVPWGREFLVQFLNGADTGADYVTHAQNQLGAGDLCILAERHHYHVRSGIFADIWSLDVRLSAYNSPF